MQSVGKQGFLKRSLEGVILAWVLLEGRAKWKGLQQNQPRRTQPEREQQRRFAGRHWEREPEAKIHALKHPMCFCSIYDHHPPIMDAIISCLMDMSPAGCKRRDCTPLPSCGLTRGQSSSHLLYGEAISLSPHPPPRGELRTIRNNLPRPARAKLPNCSHTSFDLEDLSSRDAAPRGLL